MTIRTPSTTHGGHPRSRGAPVERAPAWELKEGDCGLGYEPSRMDHS
jgi:hypothetical protein